MIFRRKPKMTPAIDTRIGENNAKLDKARAAQYLAIARAGEANEALHAFLGIPTQADSETLMDSARTCEAAGGERAVAMGELMGNFVATADGLQEATADYEAAGVEFMAATQSVFKDLGLKPPAVLT